MTTIQAYELADDLVLATRVFAAALSFAPDLNDLEGDNRAIAVLILQGVIVEAKGRGSRFIRGERTLSSGVDYVAAGWFSDEDRAALIHLSKSATTATLEHAGAAAGNFPTDYTTSNIWHEHYEGSTDPHYQRRERRWLWWGSW